MNPALEANKISSVSPSMIPTSMADGIFVGLPHKWEQLLKVSSCDLNFPLPNPGTTEGPVFQDGKKHGHGLPWSIGRMSEVKISQVPCCFSIFPRPETSPKVAKVFQVLLPPWKFNMSLQTRMNPKKERTNTVSTIHFATNKLAVKLQGCI